MIDHIEMGNIQRFQSFAEAQNTKYSVDPSAWPTVLLDDVHTGVMGIRYRYKLWLIFSKNFPSSISSMRKEWKQLFKP